MSFRFPFVSKVKGGWIKRRAFFVSQKAIESDGSFLQNTSLFLPNLFVLVKYLSTMKRRQSGIRKDSGNEIISAILAVEARLLEIKVLFYDFVLQYLVKLKYFTPGSQ